MRVAIFSLLLLVFSISTQAQTSPIESEQPTLIKASIPPYLAPTQYDDFGMSLLVYASIIGVYLLYWLKHKA